MYNKARVVSGESCLPVNWWQALTTFAKLFPIMLSWSVGGVSRVRVWWSSKISMAASHLFSSSVCQSQMSQFNGKMVRANQELYVYLLVNYLILGHFLSADQLKNWTRPKVADYSAFSFALSEMVGGNSSTSADIWSFKSCEFSWV